MDIIVKRAGIQCSIQDRGRFGYRHLGVPISGWMDGKSATMANLLLNNTEDDAVLEIGILGPDLIFDVDTWIVITGSIKKATVNSNQVSNNTVVRVEAGDVLSIKSGNEGVWSYLGVKGGFINNKVLGSRSTYANAHLGLPVISKNDILPILGFGTSYTLDTKSRLPTSKKLSKSRIRVARGPEFESLSSEQKDVFFKNPFSIGKNSNRMAYFLNENSDVLKNQNDILTSPVAPGTVQLPPSGVPMVLMKDAQTTGGYARVLQVIREDLSGLAQIRVGENVNFKLIRTEVTSAQSSVE